MNAQTRLAAAALVAAALCGCRGVMTYDQINKVWHDSGATVGLLPRSVWYYQGSDDRCHYFVRSKMFSDRSYKVAKSEIVVGGAFPLTQTRSEWKRINVRLASFQTPATVHLPQALDFAER